MEFARSLREGEFVRRYKRFFADIRLGGREIVAHLPNTGTLRSVLMEGAPCLVSESSDPARKLKATLHYLKTPGSWVGVDTSLPNLLVHEAWEQKTVKAWRSFSYARREYKISPETRLDLVLAPDP